MFIPNKIVKVLIASDFFLFSAWGLIAPVFAIFVVQHINGGDAKVAGIAVGIYWIGKSLIQVPVGNWLDKRTGEKDDYYAMIFGTFLASSAPLGFIFASEPWHIYTLQGVHALGMAMAIPPWGGLFTRHIDKGREAVTWGLESTSLGLGAGIAGIMGGFIVTYFGFTFIFILVSILGMIAAISFIFIKDEMLPKDGIVIMEKKVGYYK